MALYALTSALLLSCIAHGLAPSSYAKASASDIKQAEELVAQAVAQQSDYNDYIVAHPRRNTYTSRPGAGARKRRRQDSGQAAPAAPVLDQTLLDAAALIAERDAKNGTNPSQNTTHAHVNVNAAAASSSYWLPQMSGHGLPPMGWNSSYPVYRDVTDPIFGAKGDGVTDDTKAIKAAIAYGGNCGENCLSSSVKGTLIYFPPGTYLISSPINALYYSQLVGDVESPPTIKTSPFFIGLGAIQTDVYIPNGNSSEWYIEVRNFVIDITGTKTRTAAGLHWQVAQATSLMNVAIFVSPNSTTQMGMFTENGSGGFMSDVIITGGAYGIYGGNQQYTVRGFSISGQTKACICIIWDWGWTWSGLSLSSAPVGISLINPEDPTGQVAGSTYIMDSSFDGIGTGVYADFNKTVMDSSIITFDNIAVNNVQNMLSYSSGDTVAIPAGDINFVIVGDVVDGGSFYGSYADDIPPRPPGLIGGSAQAVQTQYYAKSRPQYADLSTGSIISVKDHGAVGDGFHDDTAAIQSAFGQASTSNLIYFPAGSYIVTSTIVVPPNIRMTGQVWSQLVASGSNFANAASPKVMLQVGNAGDVGTVEISDMLFTSTGALPGLVLMEWNVQASSQGSVGLWDSHFRLGGGYGSKLQVGQCPLQGPLQSSCTAAAMMLHITPNANGYFENMWLWVADHDIDDPQNTMVAVAAGRGLLVESSGPTWLYGTASEHSMLYQYNFVGSSNIMAGMIQTESPYFQGVSTGTSPGPFNSTLGSFTSDPTFPDSTCNGTDFLCDFSWAVMMQNTTNLTIAGAGLYSWFGNYIGSCVDTQDCQQRLVFDDGNNGGLRIFNLITIGAVEMVSSPELNISVLAKPNTQALGHPFWSALAAYLDSAEQIILSCDDDDTSPECFVVSTCDLSNSFDSFLALQAAVLIGSNPVVGGVGGIELGVQPECVDYFALNTIGNVLNASLTNYTSANDGYDAAFGYYQDYIKEIIPEVLQNVMAQSMPGLDQGGPGNQYFNCTLTHYGAGGTHQCPFTWRELLGAPSFTMTFTLVDPDGFYGLLQSQYGIQKSWVAFTTTDSRSQCVQHAPKCEDHDYRNVNIPTAASDIDVPNPKDIITQALPTIGSLMNKIMAAQIDLNTGQWNSSSDDLVQSYSMPVLMVQQAVQSMQDAKQQGQQYEKQKKIELVLEILGAVFAVLPFLDDFAPELEIADGFANLAAQAGNTALAIQSIIANPSSAPVEILGLILSPGGRSEDEVAAIADKRRALSDADISGLGSDFKANNDELENAVKPVCRL